ncbi:Os07g0222501 [Oryza sativa Japonica Group]|uniref:Os07g0222501 protein n=1 Tax=Oryza sativa subsp. japonica TaxID=39947 RepID=A0A0P0X4C9_ORYSJ|nr:Os07g0222501 [Oryza sativa Japonica Group]
MQAAGSNGNLGLIKGGWTREEDEVLRQMVRHHGDCKWTEIAKSLPSQTGKQCRERWTNHLYSEIKVPLVICVVLRDPSSLSMQFYSWNFFRLCKTPGNFIPPLEAIVRWLLGWSENTVKNHWNPTKRSLNSKQRLRKKNSEKAAPGQPSHLEECICSFQNPLLDETAPPLLAPPAPFDIVRYGTCRLIGVIPTPPAI